MKITSAFLAFFLMAVSAFAGPFVSEGTGSGGNILECSSRGSDSSFVIRRTAVVTLIQGLYIQGDSDPVNMKCKNSGEGWSCQELTRLGGENVLYASAYRNSQGFTTVQIYRRNFAGQKVTEDSLACNSSAY